MVRCTLHEILSNKIQFHIQGTINYYQVKTVLEMQRQFKMRKSMHIIHFSNKYKGKNPSISFINTKKTFNYKNNIYEGRNNQFFCNMLIFIQFNLISESDLNTLSNEYIVKVASPIRGKSVVV